MSLHRRPEDVGAAEGAPGPREARIGAVFLWVLFLAGPLIWALHFVVVYLLTEAVCRIDRYRFDFEVGGVPGVSVLVLTATVAAVGVMAVFAVRAWGEWRRGSDGADGISRLVGFGGLLLDLVFALAVVSVGLPAIALSPC